MGNLTCYLPKLLRCQIFPAACSEMSVIPWKYFLFHGMYHRAIEKFPSLPEKTEFARVYLVRIV